MLSSLLSAISIGEKIVLIIANLREFCRDKNSLKMKVIICYIEVYEEDLKNILAGSVPHTSNPSIEEAEAERSRV